MLLAFTNLTHALDLDEWTLDVNTASKHRTKTYGLNKTYNEDNDGLGITYGYTPSIDIKLGYFDNSYHKRSVYLGASFNKDFYFHNKFVISPGIGLMFTTGYDDTPINAPVIAPIPHPSISFGFKTLRSTIGYIPSGDGVLTFQTQVQF